MAQRDKQYKVPFLQLVTPPDGLCCYHCINAISLGDEWKSVSRLSNGFAVNPRIRKSEAETAKALRQKAIQSTPNDSQLQDLARDAMKYLSVCWHSGTTLAGNCSWSCYSMHCTRWGWIITITTTTITFWYISQHDTVQYSFASFENFMIYSSIILRTNVFIF